MLGFVGMFSTLSRNASGAEVSFRQDVAPILARRCAGCHDQQVTEGGYALHTSERLWQSGDSGQLPISPGKPEESYLFTKLIAADDSERMPLDEEPLPADQIELIRQWILQGAQLDLEPSLELRSLLPRAAYPIPPVTYPRPVPTFALCFAPDGQQLWVGGWHELLVYDVDQGQLLHRIHDLPRRIHDLAISPDGAWLAVAGGTPGESGEVVLLPTSSLADSTIASSSVPRKVFSQWQDEVLAVSFDPQSQLLIAGGADSTLACLQIADGTLIWKTRHHVDWITDISVVDYRFHEETLPLPMNLDFLKPTEQELRDQGRRRRFWEFDSGRIILRESDWEAEFVKADNNKLELIRLTRVTETGVGANRQVSKESIARERWAEFDRLLEHLRSTASMLQDHAMGSGFVVTSSLDRTAKVARLENGESFTTYKGHRREYGPLRGLFRVHTIHAEPESRRVWTAGEGNHLHGWDPVSVRDEDGTAADMEERFAREYSVDLLRHNLNGPVLSWTAHGNDLLVAGESGGIRAFTYRGDRASYALEPVAHSLSYEGVHSPIYAVDFSMHQNAIATCGQEGTVVIWDLGTRERRLSFSVLGK